VVRWTPSTPLAATARPVGNHPEAVAAGGLAPDGPPAGGDVEREGGAQPGPVLGAGDLQDVRVLGRGDPAGHRPLEAHAVLLAPQAERSGVVQISRRAGETDRWDGPPISVDVIVAALVCESLLGDLVAESLEQLCGGRRWWFGRPVLWQHPLDAPLAGQIDR
jgi:hypothetical protein